MKVLFINTVLQGSTGKIITQLSEMLSENNFDYRVFYGRGIDPPSDREIKIGSKLSTSIHGLQTRVLDHHGFGSCQATRRLISQINEYHPDIIHLHNLHGYYINIEILFEFLKKYDKPIIWTLHDCWPITGHCAYFNYIECNKWKNKCENCPQKKAYPKSIFLDNSRLNFKRKKAAFLGLKHLTLVTPSNWLKTIMKDSIFKDYAVKVIYNGINLNQFKYELNNEVDIKYNLHEKIMILGVANVWDRRKGLDDYMTLSRMLEGDKQIFLVGLNNEQIRNLPSNIIGIQQTSNVNELVALYSRADVFFNPSHEETFGMVTAEAMACGTPAIVYDATASPELIEDNCGYVVEESDLKSVCERIAEIQRKGKKSYSESCIRKVQNDFNQRKQYPKYLELYKAVLREIEKKGKHV